ncbi:MAG: hypothetical protein LAT61_15060 [Alcanivorax sp.]|nr:hypothetical protein [Alcanivorax sp.]
MRPKVMSHVFYPFSALLVFLVLLGCSAPGGYHSATQPRPMPVVTTTGPIAADDNVVSEKVVNEVPLAEMSERFPAQIVVARVVPRSEHRGAYMCQASSHYCLVTSRDVESQEQYSRLMSLPGITGMRMLTPLIVSGKIMNMEDLRVAAAGLHADMLLVYMVQTQENTSIGRSWPLDVATLGLLPSKQNNLVVTASATLYDTRTGYVYGTLEAATRADLRTSMWNGGLVDASRIAALEREAFATLVERFEPLWESVLRIHAAELLAHGP